MSQYYQSNQSYNSAHQQKDGLANGAIVGGLAGVGAAGGAHKFGGKILSSYKDKLDTNLYKKSESLYDKYYDSNSKDMNVNMYEAESEKANRKHLKKTEFAEKNQKLHNKSFGRGWKSKVAAYGVSGIVGMGAGMGLDTMHNGNK